MTAVQQQLRTELRGRLYRGSYELPHQSQEIRRDLTGETVLQHPDAIAAAYALSDAELAEQKRQQPGLLPYRFLIQHPASAALAWTAFYRWQDLRAWLEAYDLHPTGRIERGQPFAVRLPVNDRKWKKLVSDGDRR